MDKEIKLRINFMKVNKISNASLCATIGTGEEREKNLLRPDHSKTLISFSEIGYGFL